jgi:hypothetical protein
MIDSAEDEGAPRRVKSLRELSRDIAPPRDLWPAIESELRPTTRSTARRPWMRLAALAAMIAMLGIGIWIGRGLLPLGGALAPQSVLSGATETMPAAFVTDPRYVSERAALLQSLEQQINALPAESRQKVLASLETIRRSKQEIEAALGRDPGNALLQQLLVNTYQDEMNVLTTVREAGRAGEEI